MNKWMELLIGLILVAVPVYAAITFASWGQATIDFLKGGVVTFFVMIGLLFILLGISDLKE